MSQAFFICSLKILSIPHDLLFFSAFIHLLSSLLVIGWLIKWLNPPSDNNFCSFWDKTCAHGPSFLALQHCNKNQKDHSGQHYMLTSYHNWYWEFPSIPAGLLWANTFIYLSLLFYGDQLHALIFSCIIFLFHTNYFWIFPHIFLYNLFAFLNFFWQIYILL